MVILGLCGLLVPDFSVGDSLVYAEIVDAQGASLVLDEALARELSAVAQRGGIRAFASDALVATPAAKSALAERYDAQVVDMESFVLARSLQAAGVTCGVLRVASDGAADELPDLSAALDPSGDLNGPRAARAFVRRPLAGARLAFNALRALRALERVVQRLLD